MDTELTISNPRLALLERRIAANPGFADRIRRPPTPKFKVRKVFLKPGQADPPDQPGTFLVLVVPTEPDIEEPETMTSMEAVPPAAEAQGLEPALTSRRTEDRRGGSAWTGRGKGPGRRPATEEDLLAQIASLEARRDELLHGPRAQTPRERVPRPAGKKWRPTAKKRPGSGRSARVAHVKAETGRG